MLDWRIYYDDGSTFTSEDGEAADAPAWGVIAIATRDPDERRDIRPSFGTDAYWYREPENRWDGGDLAGLFDVLAHRLTRVVCFGRSTGTADYQRILARACDDRLED